MKRIKNISIPIAILLIVFAGYTIYINKNTINMTPRQKILKAVYPALMWFTKLTKTNTTILNNESAQPPVSFYSLQATTSYDSQFNFSLLKGKKILIVNTASDCGYTYQYADLEKLYRQYQGSVEIIAFPANDFKEQEKGNDADIASFCKKNYGVSFAIMAKSIVVASANQNPVFKWLTNAGSNGWNSKAPSWNFSKYLVNEKGQLTNYFDPGVSPLSKEILSAIARN